MKFFSYFVTILALALHLVAAAGSRGPQFLTSASNTFANQLYKVVSKDNSESNVLICPISLHVALALVHEGAGGNTANQLAQALAINNNGNIAPVYKTLLQGIQEGDSLKIATKLYPAKAFQLMNDYVQHAKEFFLSDVENVDYNQPAAAANTINKYVEDHTNNKIHNLISADSLSALTRLVIVNAVHFQAKWKQVFDSSYDGTFKVTPDNQVPTKLMTQSGDFMYKDDAALGAKVLKMDYETGDYSMIFILPNNELTGLKEVEAKLTDMTLEGVLKDMKLKNVDVTIPKFTMEQTIDLKDVLQEMGIVDLFSARADLRKVANGEGLFVSKVVQKTFINVHENGTEAAAATGFIETLSAVSFHNKFEARRPFLFYLVHEGKQKRLVLFQGKFKVPRKLNPSERGNKESTDQKLNTAFREDDNRPIFYPGDRIDLTNTKNQVTRIGEGSDRLSANQYPYGNQQFQQTNDGFNNPNVNQRVGTIYNAGSHSHLNGGSASYSGAGTGASLSDPSYSQSDNRGGSNPSYSQSDRSGGSYPGYRQSNTQYPTYEQRYFF